jgi:hypothetical protein
MMSVTGTLGAVVLGVALGRLPSLCTRVVIFWFRRPFLPVRARRVFRSPSRSAERVVEQDPPSIHPRESPPIDISWRYEICSASGRFTGRY